MQDTKLKPRYYSVKQIQQMENSGRDYAYDLARRLPHERRGRDIYVFAEEYDRFYEEKREKAKTNVDENTQHTNAKIYQIKKFS